jgi:hypothetical protein
MPTSRRRCRRHQPVGRREAITTIVIVLFLPAALSLLALAGIVVAAVGR